jgi:PBP1b-binding outer membrane lipoprotein LpoB
MKSKLSFYLLTLACPLIWVGCATAPHVVEGPNRVPTMGISTADFAAKADDMIQSLVESSVLDKSPRKPAILVVGRIANNTAQQLDTDLLAKKIRVALNKSGKAMTDTTGGALSDPDFTLSGKIIQGQTRYGNLRESSFTFQLSLSNPQGLAVWEEEKEIIKQSERPAVGF